MSLIFSNHFPYKSIQNAKHKYTYIIGIGGNIGNVKLRFDMLFKNLFNNNKFTILQTSPLLINPPFGYLEQDDFINGIMQINTSLPLLKFLKSMQKLELRYGRKRSFKDAPRTLDIDIIFAKNKQKILSINHKDLIIPHPSWKQRESVTIPLEYIK
jgi:2-amino-4-hydroxy-6-hydroxymethyldihydropteridine diphosphokinase